MNALKRPVEPRYSEDAFRTFLDPATIAGVIKTTPADFIVREQLPSALDGNGEHIYVKIKKIDANTGWVAHQLAEFLQVKDGDIGYAGRKDRHAETTQWFSCYVPGSSDIDWQNFECEGAAVQEITRHRSKLRPGQLAHNEFELVIRHETLSSDEQSELDDRFSHLLTEGFANYFGSQRFGRDSQNLDAADRLLRFREKGSGNRGMVISAARSWLFNRYLSDRLAEGSDLRGELGPLIGKSRDPQPGELALNEIEQSWVSGLRRLGAKVGERALVVVPGQMQWQSEDIGTRLTFNLPPGSYATSLLRELFVVRDASR
jgi:tRNA pseudouridine13 synthase